MLGGIRGKWGLLVFVLQRFFLPHRTGRRFRGIVILQLTACRDYFLQLSAGRKVDNAVLERFWQSGCHWRICARLEPHFGTGYRFFMTELLFVSDVLFSLHAVCRQQAFPEWTGDCLREIGQLFEFLLQGLNLVDPQPLLPNVSETCVKMTQKLHENRSEMTPSAWSASSGGIQGLETLSWLLLRLASTLRSTI